MKAFKAIIKPFEAPQRRGFLTFSGDKEMEHWAKMGYAFLRKYWKHKMKTLAICKC